MRRAVIQRSIDNYFQVWDDKNVAVHYMHNNMKIIEIYRGSVK